jgi:hypothetical protein
MSTFSARAKAALMVAEYADLHGLPEPRSVSASVVSGEVDLHLASVADVETWAEQIGADLKKGRHWVGFTGADMAEGLGVLYEIPLRLYGFDQDKRRAS